MKLREILPYDAKEYQNLRLASEKEYPQYVGASVEHELSLNLEDLTKHMSKYPDSGNYLFGIFENDRLTGAAALLRKKSQKYSHKAFLWGMYVYPEYRKTGISKSLMDHAILWCQKKKDILALQLFVTTTNAKAISFYEKYGFKRYGTELKHMFAAGEFHDAHLLELDLNQ
jgi:GNAT superfamily N-acetyltransferase